MHALSLGPQISDHTLAMVSDGRTDSDFRLGGALSVGAGIDAWITDRLVAGLALSYNGTLMDSDPTQSFDIGLSVGYAWDLTDD